MSRMDEMFTVGPELLVSQASTILAGPVSNFAKTVKEMSQGSDPIPTRWVISGQLAKPEALRGAAPNAPYLFTREEQTPFLPPREPVSEWEADLGQWQPDDKAVVFLGKKGEVLRVLPSGTGPRDLLSQVRLIASMLAAGRDASAQAAAWTKHLATGSMPAGEDTRIALRSLMRLTHNWNEVMPALRGVMIGNDSAARRYAFGIVAYEVTHQKWADPTHPVEFLCKRLAAEKDLETANSYLEYVDMMLRFASDEDLREQRKPLREQLRSCLKEQCLQAGADVAAACKSVLGRYPR